MSHVWKFISNANKTVAKKDLKSRAGRDLIFEKLLIEHKNREIHIIRVLKGKTLSQAAAELNVRVDTLLAWIGELQRIGKISDYIIV